MASSSTVAPSAIVLELLNLDNYEHWSRRVKTYLLAEGLWKVVKATADPDPKPEDDAWSRQNAKALHVIHISCGSVIFSLISDFNDTTSARHAWDMLARKFKSAYFDHTDETSNFTSPVHGGRRQYDENLEMEEEEEATDGHENSGANVALQEAFRALFNNTTADGYIHWDQVMEFLKQHPEAVRIRGPKSGHTCLHIAVFSGVAELVKEMVRLITEEDLEIKDVNGYTAFYYAVRMPLWENLKIVESLVGKNNALVTSCVDEFPHKNVIPVLLALVSNNWEVFDYLYYRTPPEALSPKNGPNGADIVTTCIQKKKFDIVWELIQRYPELATTQDFSGNCPLNLLAGMRSAFLSGTPLIFWQRWIYNCIRIHDDFTSFHDHRIDVQTPEIDEWNQMDLIESAMGRQVELPFWRRIRTHCKNYFQELFMALPKLLGIFDRIYKVKLIHVRVLRILKCMSQVTRCNVKQLHDSVVQRAIFRAIQHGHVEFVTVLVMQNPYTDALAICDKRGRRIFQFAVECRQEKIYNLLYEYTDELYINLVGDTVDNFNNSLLHLVGSLSPLIQFNHIRDAALQMQRELQWFKEMERVVPPSLHELVNFADNMTGRELFTKNHKELVKEGEKSMKNTATSCTVVGALIVTIMFAAAFTVGGGNDENTGLPVFLDDTLFMVFIFSDALSLFSSTTSVMMFTGILTSRYQEDDFLKSLPTKMMVGLLTLFFSIATMMVAFSTTLIIMLRDKYSWIVVPIIVLACIPITSFVWMQFPLLLEICVSTYGPGISGKRLFYSRRHRLKMFHARMKEKVVRAFTPTLKDKV